MNDELLLEILHGKGDLPEVIPSFDFADLLSSFYELVHCLVCADFQKDIDTVGIFEVFLVLDHKLGFD